MKYLYSLLCLFFSIGLTAQNNLWTTVDNSNIALSRDSEMKLLPTEYQAVQLEFPRLQKILAKTPHEFNQQKGIIIPIPMPDGSLEDFEVWESSIMEEGLATRYPSIKTFKGRSINNPSIVSRLGYSNIGFHAIIQSPEGIILIDRIATKQTSYYTTSFAKHSAVTEEMKSMTRSCGTASLDNHLEEGLETAIHHSLVNKGASRNTADPVDLYIYRAAIATSGEYAEFHQANSKVEVLSHITATMNQANIIYERDLALRMILIEEIDSLIFLDPATDPYSDGSNVASSYTENATAIETRVSADKFDIGHVFIAQCGGGVVGIGGGKVCDFTKSSGISCQFGSDANFAINLVCHEMGHQMYANHSWTNCPGNESNQAGGTAYEPGSGSTIMSYAGACGNRNNIQNSADGYFHVTNLQEILTDKLAGRTNGCAVKMPTGNLKPEAVINYENGFYIPISTPFELKGDGIDENGDELTYCWEQYNTGPSIDLGTPAGSTPIFRSFPPTTEPTRVFPRMFNILNNRNDVTEVLPTYKRNLTFRLTVRDNNVEAGGVDWKNLSFEVTEDAGPFLVEFPNRSKDSVHVGDFTEIRWDVAGTNTGRVNCQKVNVLLSTDGGDSFPHVLLENTPNDGVQAITIPDLVTTRARIRIEAADNIFFDLSNQNFAILSPLKAGFSLATSIQEQQVCLPGSITIDISSIGLLNFNQPITISGPTSTTNGLSVDITNSTINPGETAQMKLSFLPDFPTEAYSFDIIGVSTGADTIVRTINLDLVSNEFTDFTITTPENNTSGVGLPNFQWIGTTDANTYEIEIATSPVFGETVVDAATNIAGTTYTPSNLLEESTIYYWRVKPINDCGTGPSSEIFAFQTQNLSCISETATEVPLIISSQGKPTIESKMTVTQNITISDLNVASIEGRHDWVSHIRTTLISPAGTKAILFSGKCPGSVPFNLGFDDESPTTLPCPPIGGQAHQPQEALSIFDGESAFGEWILQIEVTDDFGEGGSLDAWSLEFCGNITTNPPILVTNEVLTVKPQTGRQINKEFLLAEDPNNTANELVYTLVKTPDLGVLSFNGMSTAAGTQFTQSDLNSSSLKYNHESEATTGEDTFTFTVTDGEGGWIGITPFQIVLDESETTVGVDNFLNDNVVQIFPNPAQNELYLTFENNDLAKGELILFDIQGKFIHSQNIDNQLINKINLAVIENGIYFLKVQLEEGVLTKKIVVQR